MKENIRFEIPWEQRHGIEFLWMNEYEKPIQRFSADSTGSETF